MLNYFAITLVKNASPEQKDFYILDIGAGDFRWGKNTAKYLNQLTDLPKDITFHIISVTGEDYYTQGIMDLGCCKIYNLGAFKIEDLEKSFQDKGLELNKKVDLIVSDYCFLHLHDPVGTFVQAYNLLRPGKGVIMTDGFPVFFNSSSNNDMDMNISKLLIATKDPFIISPNTIGARGSQFLLKRLDQNSLHLSLSYADAQVEKFSNMEAKKMAYYTQNEDFPKDRKINSYNKLIPSFLGNKELYVWIYDNYPDWKNIEIEWKSLFKDVEEEKITSQPASAPLLIEAVKTDNLQEIKKLLEQGDNLNVKDNQGNPLLSHVRSKAALDYLLQQKNIDLNVQNEEGYTLLFRLSRLKRYGSSEEFEEHLNMLKLILEAGAKVNIRAVDGSTPLHSAVNSSNSALAINLLIQHGADINAQDNEGNTPLHRAVQSDFTNSIKILLEKKADVTIRNKENKAPYELRKAYDSKEIKKIFNEYFNIYPELYLR